MTQDERLPASSLPSSQSNTDMDDPVFRRVYADTLTQQFLARQARAFRGDLSQAEFAAKLGLKQNDIHRLENPNHINTVKTLRHVGHKLDVVYFGRWVDFDTFLGLTTDFSERDIRPPSYDDLRAARDADAPSATTAPKDQSENVLYLGAHTTDKGGAGRPKQFMAEPPASGDPWNAETKKLDAA